ncbi:MAG: phosphosulfolactate synthase [Halobacteriota archaeon]|nr:phosphosulfolactate synthase [Halobacteriota archaeon]
MLPEKRVVMMLDKGIGLKEESDLIETSKEYVTFAKIGWGISRVLPEELLKKKIETYKEADIIAYPGGTCLESALLQERLEEFTEWCKEVGFGALEVSNGSIEITEEEKCELISRLSKDFIVLSEVGKKDPTEDRELSISERADYVRRELKAGSYKVITEARESGKDIGFYDGKGEVKQDEIDEFLKLVRWEDVIFEAPEKKQQVYFIKNIDPDVNLGNIASREVIALETLRRGLRGDTLMHIFNLLKR